MPLDRSRYCFACSICEEAFESSDRKKAYALAERCESGGPPPEPLPEGTLIVSDGFERGGDAGGLRFARVAGHEIRSHARGWSEGNVGHYLVYDVEDGARNTTYSSQTVYPHKPGVLNAHSRLAANVIHADRLETVLRDPARAAELAQVLAQFGCEISAAELVEAADSFYSQIDFGSVNRGGDGEEPFCARYLRLVGPLSAAQLELLTVFARPPVRHKATTPARRERGFRFHAGHGEAEFPEMGENDWWRAVFAFALEQANGSVARARAYTHTRSAAQIADDLERRLDEFFSGAPVAVPAALLQPTADLTVKGQLKAAGQKAARGLAGVGSDETGFDEDDEEVDLRDPQRAMSAVLRSISRGVPVIKDSRLFEKPYVLAVASGKGGVGKSTVAAATAIAATARGLKAAVVDVDFHGPSQPALLGLHSNVETTPEGKIRPTVLADGTRAFSLGQLLSDDTPVDWRGAAVEGFLLFIGSNLELEDCDLVVLDLPPGTGEIERAVVEHLRPDGSLLVTTGSHLSHADCRRAATYLNDHTGLVGVVENLSRRDVTLPDGSVVEGRLFGEAGDTEAFVSSLALERMQDGAYKPVSIPFLGSLPFEADPYKLAASDEFQPVIGVVAAALQNRTS
jgi:ATP-binding protein involved in chromosome partitioning